MKKDNPVKGIDSIQLELNFFVDGSTVHYEEDINIKLINEGSCTTKIINFSDRLHNVDKEDEQKIIDYIVLNSKRF